MCESNRDRDRPTERERESERERQRLLLGPEREFLCFLVREQKRWLLERKRFLTEIQVESLNKDKKKKSEKERKYFF